MTSTTIVNTNANPSQFARDFSLTDVGGHVIEKALA